MNSLCISFSRRRGHPAFLEQIMPGLIGGVASSVSFYPLEVCETLIQGASAAKLPPSLPVKRRRLSPHKASSLPQFAHLSGIDVAKKAYCKGYFFKGFDMAFLSAIFGYSTFFALMETGIGGSDTVAILARTSVAAAASYLVNSPFQLLKTTIILAEEPVPSHKLLRDVTCDGRHILNLWHGSLANSLGVLFVSAQWTLYQLLEFSSISLATCPDVNNIICGMMATAFAVVLTYPASVLRTAIMANRSEDAGEKRFTKLFSLGNQMRRDGTLYNGVFTSVVRTTIPSAVFFGVKVLLT